jgi:hypothetical protein
VKTTLRGVFLEGLEKCLRRGTWFRSLEGMIRDNCLIIEGRITKTDLGTEGTQGLSLYI